MTVNGVNGAGMAAGSAGMSQGSDPVSKNLQRQIADAQKKLQELSDNKDLSSEEKMKKRQELQQTINDLNMQLRQHQIDERRAKQKEQESFDDMLGGEQKIGKEDEEASVTISAAGMEALISAGAAMDQAKVHGSVATKMEGRAGVLKAEIALDSARSGESAVAAKKAELADVEKTAMDAVSSQMSSLAEADKAMEKASDTDKKTEAEKSEDEKDEEEENASEGIAAENADGVENVTVQETTQGMRYVPVDVKV